MIIHEELNRIREQLTELSEWLNDIDSDLHDRSMDPSTTGDEMMKLIRNEMKAQGIKQRELAEATECTPAAVCRYLSGKRKPSVEFLIQSLEVVGYKVQVVPVLTFTPEGAEDGQDM